MSELVEVGRRLKRSLDGYISYRRAAAIAVLILGTVRGVLITVAEEHLAVKMEERK